MQHYKRNNTVASEHVSFAQNIPQMCLWPRLCLGPAGGAYSSSQTPSWIWGGKEGEKKEMEDRVAEGMVSEVLDVTDGLMNLVYNIVNLFC